MDSVHMKYDVPWVFFFFFFSSLCYVAFHISMSASMCVDFCTVDGVCVWLLCLSFYRFFFLFSWIKQKNTHTLFALEPAYNQRWSFYVNLFAFEYDCGKKKIEHTHTETAREKRWRKNAWNAHCSMHVELSNPILIWTWKISKMIFIKSTRNSSYDVQPSLMQPTNFVPIQNKAHMCQLNISRCGHC